MNKQRALKILVPVFILAVIVGVWAVKNNPIPTDPVAPSSTSDDAADLVQPYNDTDFVLGTSAVALEALTAYGLPLIIDFGWDSCILCKEMPQD